jgi:hypothetical protein
MSHTPLLDREQEMPELNGHSVGFVDTQIECDRIVQELNAAGIPDSAITVLRGDDGTQLFKRMMHGQLWGETGEDLLARGTNELSQGHLVLMIESQDRDRATLVADISTKLGGHGFYYFGEFTDERLTS